MLEGSLVEFSPKLKTLANVVNTIGKDLTASLTVLPRLLDVLTPVKSKKKVDIVLYSRSLCECMNMNNTVDS